MSHLSFGRAVYLWRETKGLTQEELAKRSGLSRPNLSMIEQDARDVTLGTARRIAFALELETGILVDGIPPENIKQEKGLTREELDRISRHLLGEKIHLRKNEQEIAGLIYSITKGKLSNQKRKTLPRTAREEKRNWHKLKVLLKNEEIQNLLSRLDKRSLAT